MRRQVAYALGGLVVACLVAGGGTYVAVGSCLNKGSAHLLLRALSLSGGVPGDATMEQARQIVLNRVTGGSSVFDFLSLCRPDVQVLRRGRARYIGVTLHAVGGKDVRDAEAMLQSRGQLTVVTLGHQPLWRGAPAAGYRVLVGTADIIPRDVVLGTTGTGGPAVDVFVRDPAARTLATYTATHIGWYLGIALDGRIYNSLLIEAPLPPGGGFQIVDPPSFDAAKDIAATLRFGTLPVRLALVGAQVTAAR